MFAVPSGAPVDIRAEAKTSTELVVTWEPPPRETWNGNLLGYHVGYQEMEQETSAMMQSYVFKSVEVRPHFGGEAVLQGLSKYAMYSIIVQVIICFINLSKFELSLQCSYCHFVMFNITLKFQ